MTDFLPNKPNVNVDTSDFIYKNWFNSLWNYIQGQNFVNVVQTAAVTASPETYFYPCDTTSATFAVTLPPAIDCLGKMYTVFHATGANALTVALSGADTMNPTTATPIALGTAVTFISDGNSIWYATMPNVSSSGSTPVSTLITATGASTYTVPTGAVALDVILQAPGGGGGTGLTGNTAAGGGGGGGERVSKRIAATSGAVLNYDNKAGGLGGTTNGANGVSGATSTFDTLQSLGGIRGTAAAGSSGGAGGGRLGGAASASPTVELGECIGGAGGGNGGAAAIGSVGGIVDGFAGGTAGAGGATAGGGGGGGASGSAKGAAGAAGINGGTPTKPTKPVFGAGGGGGGSGGAAGTFGQGGDGGDGYILITPVY